MPLNSLYYVLYYMSNTFLLHLLSVSIIIKHKMYSGDMANDEKMRKKGETKVPISARLEPDLHKDLMEYIDEGNWVQNGVIEKALRQFLDREKKKK
jgi:hypothetical protein